MSIISKRLVSIAASTLVLSLVSASANAQTIDVFNGIGNIAGALSGDFISTFQFTSDMTLNSIGFLTTGYSAISLSYEIANDGVGYRSVVNTGVQDSSGIQWFDLGSGLNMQSGSIVRVKTRNQYGAVGVPGAINSAANVSYLGVYSEEGHKSGTGWTSGNLRVTASNPGSNVAPEPGSFALALTGGAALLGICVRRRRNAG
jgi:hypothetical protein